jgi:uncharacterized protein YaaQ
MKKNKFSYGLVTALVLSLISFSAVSAQETTSFRSNTGAGVNSVEPNKGRSDDAPISGNANVNATERSVNQNTSVNTNSQNSQKPEESSKGSITSESHRSAVSKYVQSLLEIADGSVGIGEKVRVIANQQNNSKEIVANAIDEVSTKGGFKTFLFGTDYKNLGVIRSEIAKSDNEIEKLKSLIQENTDSIIKATLETQMNALLVEQAKIESFIKLHESKFSLLGWFVKMFNK